MSGVRLLGDFVGQSTPRSKQFGTQQAQIQFHLTEIPNRMLSNPSQSLERNYPRSRTCWVDDFYFFPRLGMLVSSGKLT